MSRSASRTQKDTRQTAKKTFLFLFLISNLLLSSCGFLGGKSLSAKSEAASTTPRATVLVIQPSTPTPPDANLQNTNLLINPGFELGLTAWQIWGNANTTSTDQRSGSLALQVGIATGGVGQDVFAGHGDQ